jgi:hypothetical protein
MGSCVDLWAPSSVSATYVHHPRGSVVAGTGVGAGTGADACRPLMPPLLRRPETFACRSRTAAGLGSPRGDRGGPAAMPQS